jgi:protein phosphatase
MTLTIDAAARTHVGLVRQRNEDSVYAGSALFAVADGLGGHIAGDVASATAIQALQPYDRPVAKTELPAALGRAISTANEALRSKVESDPELLGMGTTLVAMLCSDDGAAILANVGDSRAYLLRDTSYRQITEDHTFGNLVAEAAANPGMSERITRFLDGRAEGRSPDLTVWDLRPGDRFLLCSDGLSGVVPDDLVRETLLTTGAPADAADRLAALAIDHGGPDNVTVLVMDARDAPED